MPRGPTILTAAAAQALGARRPAAPELPGAEVTLLRSWGVDGWPTAYDAARVAAALLNGAPAAGSGPARVRLDGEAILGDGAAFSAVQRAALPLAELPERPRLEVETRGPATYLTAYSVPQTAPGAPARLSVVQALVDPASGAPVDPAGLRAGQLVGIQLTAVVARPLVRAELEVALPAGLALVAATPRAPFQHAGPADDQVVRVGAADLSPGVYSQLILARAVAPGEFDAPPARLIATHEPGQVAVAPAGLRVTIGE